MIKSVIKEIFIILLLSIAILLILGILFYDYIPMNKVIPQKEAYTTPNDVQKELEEAITETEKVEVTYEVTDSDLNIYKQSGSYTEGKANPFMLESTSENTSNGEYTNSNGQTNTNENSTNTFWNDEGIK